MFIFQFMLVKYPAIQNANLKIKGDKQICL